MAKTLVLYYSFEGSTKKMAEWIAREIKADIAVVRPERELKAKGFSKFILGGGQVMMKRKPPIKPLEINLDDYDTVFLGSPIWAGTFAPPINTLLGNAYLKNKKIAYFYCYEGGDKKALAKAKQAINKENIFISAFACLSVTKNFDTIKEKAGAWAKNIVKECDSE